MSPPMSAQIITIIAYLIPFMVAIQVYYLLKENVSKFDIFAMICCFIGVMIISLSQRADVEQNKDEPLTKDKDTLEGRI